MRFVSYNIQYGTGQDGRVDLARIAAEIGDADVIALQEVERYWRRSGNQDQVALISALFPEHYWAYGPGVDVHIAASVPGPASGSIRRQFGNMLLSRVPLGYVRHHLLPKYASVTDMSLQRSALEAVIEVAGTPLRIYSVHLTHLSAVTRLAQADALLAIHDGARRAGAPVTGNRREWFDDGQLVLMPSLAILMGDFNAEPDSDEYTAFVGPRSYSGGRVENPERFVDAYAVTERAEQSGATSYIGERQVRIDYCFVSTELADSIAGAGIESEAVGSDHQPIWMQLNLDAKIQLAQDPLDQQVTPRNHQQPASQNSE